MSVADCQVLSTLTPFPEAFRGGAVTIGKFDAVHLGHAEILRRTVAHAKRYGIPSVAVTFDPPPLELLRPHSAPLPLCTLPRKIDLIAAEGIDAVCVVPTSRELLDMEAEDFFSEILQKTFRARVLIEGATFTFGKNRAGSAETLQTLAATAGIEVEIVPALEIDGRAVSSSRLRHLIEEGEIEDAARLMVRPYRITGTVVHGARRGRTLGFPTANLDAIATLLPKSGIYAGCAQVDETEFQAAVHIGPLPTFGVSRQVVEVHLLDFNGSLYGKNLPVDLLAPVRPVMKFDTAEALVAQMHADIHLIRQRFGHCRQQ